ncbi:hypothetical protein GE115_12480 [Agromyces sp. CFH 90414]|uniref:Uncharacterized protein n=1 Tax=Agromyces agglutinans TaxID=2662258 RepID=A0A6I2FIX3_9MICO|nr:hypothetical protein [Agromyces agglutinans]MRG60678.1 hypothetical protein [Agromyces agglutinans]
MNAGDFLERLDATDLGSFIVTTESGSIYELRINADRAVMIRHPAVDAPLAADASHLYFDNAPIECRFRTIRVGNPAAFVFTRADRDDVPNYAATVRATTEVRSIRRLDSDTADGGG